MMRLVSTLALVAALAAQPALAQQGAQQTQGADEASLSKRYGTWGVDTSGMDRSIRPGDDFAMYAFGKWYRDAVIPPGMPAAWNRMDMQMRNNAKIRIAIEESARNPDTPNRRLVGNLYASYVDTARLDQLDDAPLRPDLAAVRAISSKAAVAQMMGRTPTLSVVPDTPSQSFFKQNISVSVKDPTRYIARLSQGGLGYGDRDLYLTEKMKASKAAYEKHVARMLGLAQWPEPERYARQIVEMETRIAEASWSNSDGDDVSKVHNFMTLAELEAWAPGFPWRPYLAAAGLGEVQNLVVTQKSAFPKIAAIFADTPLDTLKAWLAFTKTDTAAPYLSARFQQARFDFWGRMRDMQAPAPRAESAVDVVSEKLVDPVSQEYVARFFSPNTKAQVREMVVNIKAAWRERIRRVDWMGPETKKEALAKLDAIRFGIGYPDHWRDFSGLSLKPDDLYGNMQKVSAYNWAWSRGRLDGPVDRDEWLLEPYTLGAQAMYSRSFMTFSMGFLQPPYFDPEADPAANYGAIGATIGHEISHFFDAGGALIDSKGVKRNWWAPEDAARFQAKVDRFVTRLDSYEEAPGEHVNGKAALREQMAHMYGLEAALDGYHLSLKGKPAPVIDGFTGDQRFFLAFAQVWQGKATDWFRKANYEHPPLLVIINDVDRNMDDWYAAFDVRPGDKLYLKPEDRSRIW